MQCLHNALIRTHHITSRKKVAKLKQAATFHDVFVLLRYGGAPGVGGYGGGQLGRRRSSSSDRDHHHHQGRRDS